MRKMSGIGLPPAVMPPAPCRNITGVPAPARNSRIVAPATVILSMLCGIARPLECHPGESRDPPVLRSGFQAVIKIDPVRVVGFDQLNFPGPLPFLDLLFTADCGFP